MNPIRKAVIGGVLTIGALGGGAIGAALINGTASAQTDTSTTTAPAAASSQPSGTSGTSGTPADGAARDPSKGGHTANGITEVLLTGDTAAKVTAAAQAAVPGGTIERVENDAEGSPYEAHMVKADGTHVTVKVDSNFSVTSIEDGAR